MKFWIYKSVLLLACNMLAVYSADAKTVHLKDYASPNTDVSVVLQKLVDENDCVIIDRGVWIISEVVYLRTGVEIKGEYRDQSILKACEAAIINKRNNFCIFATVRMKRSAISWRNLPEDQYDHHIKNVKLSNLTFDLNRHVDFFKGREQKIKQYGVVAVRFENCSGAKLVNCRFVDYCEYDKNEDNVNRIAVVYLIDCVNCKVSKNKTDDCTFVYVVFGKNNIIEKNEGKNSWGTWIETVDGTGHIIANNTIRNVWCRVSTIGVNSMNCTVKGNLVENNTQREISCLTIGHEDRKRTTCETKANGTKIYCNTFITTGDLGILVQSGSSLSIKNNYIQVNPQKTSSFHAGIGISGDETNFNHIEIKNNTIHITSGLGFGIVGQNMNDAVISGNVIGSNLKCGIKLWKSARHAVLKKNRIEGAETPTDLKQMKK